VRTQKKVLLWGVYEEQVGELALILNTMLRDVAAKPYTSHQFSTGISSRKWDLVILLHNNNSHTVQEYIAAAHVGAPDSPVLVIGKSKNVLPDVMGATRILFCGVSAAEINETVRMICAPKHGPKPARPPMVFAEVA